MYILVGSPRAPSSCEKSFCNLGDDDADLFSSTGWGDHCTAAYYMKIYLSSIDSITAYNDRRYFSQPEYFAPLFSPHFLRYSSSVQLGKRRGGNEAGSAVCSPVA